MRNLDTLSLAIIICLMFAAFASFYSASFNQLGLYVALPLAFTFSFIKNNGLLKTNTYIKCLWILYVLILFSVLYASNTQYALREVHQILGVVLISYIFGVNTKNQKVVPALYCVYFLLYLSIWYYAKENIIDDITFGEDRLDDNRLNANVLAYYTFYITFSIFILGEILKERRKRKWLRFLFFFTIPLSFIVAIYSASRQVIIIQTPLIAILLYLRYLTKVKRSKKILFLFATIVTLAFVLPYVQSIYENSLLYNRNEQAYEEDIRVMLMKDSFWVGINHFFTGVGAGNYVAYSFDGHFSHNTYLELFANNGIIGVSIFSYLLIKFMRDQYRRYKESNDKLFLYFFIFGVMYALDCFFYVFHAKSWLMGFFILVSSHADSYYKNKVRLLYILLNEENSNNYSRESV